MINELQVFNHERFGALEAILIDGKAYFPATHCAEILGYEKPHNAIERHCRYSLKRGVEVQTGVKVDGSPAMQMVEKNFISESDLIRLIMHSKLPAAQAFEHWVIEEIVPSVLRHGLYAIDDVLNDPDMLIKALTAVKEERAQRTMAEQKAHLLEVRMDESAKWYSVKRWACEHHTNWRYLFDDTGRGLGWRKLKALSIEGGYEIKRCFDANYGEVNLYHRKVFEMMPGIASGGESL